MSCHRTLPAACCTRECCGAGVEYWLVKNEWSANWGDEGYIKVAQDHDCAVATEAFFVTP